MNTKMKNALLVMSLSLLLHPVITTAQEADYSGSSFNQIWSQIKSDPYTELPPSRKLKLDELTTKLPDHGRGLF